MTGPVKIKSERHTPHVGSLRTGFARDGERSFSGFVVDPDASHRRFVVEILLDGYPLKTVRADLFASELAQDAIGDGCYGFSATLDEEATRDGAVVEARLANTETLVGSPIALDHPSGARIDIRGRGEVRWVGGLRFSGWLASSGSSAHLQAFVDGILVSEVASSSWRHVGTVEDARPVRALDFHLPHRFADGRVHRLTIQTVRGEQLRESPIAFVAFPNGLRDALAASGDAASRGFDADLVNRLWPNSVSFGQYREWRKHIATAVESAETRIAVAIIGAEDTKATFASLKQQAYRNWVAFALPATDAVGGFHPERLRGQLAGSAAHAEVVLFGLVGTRFHADALQRISNAFVAEREAMAVYGDFDVQGADRSLWPIALPAFDYERMLEQGYCCRIYAMRRDALERSLATGACDLYRLFNAMFDDDHATRGGVFHIPGALGVTPPIDQKAASVALAAASEGHLSRRGVRAEVTPQGSSTFPAVWVRRSDPSPPTTIVIPWRNQRDQLERCLSSIEPAAAKLSARILIVDSDSAQPIPDTWSGASARAPVRSLRVLGEYNHSLLLNAGVAAAQTELVCLLNPNIRALDDAWLGELLSRVAASDAGAAGALVRWPNGVVRHGGIVVGPGFSAVDAFCDRLASDGGYGDMLRVSRECSAVSSACLVTRRQDFLAVGGFDELRFPTFLADVDFCLKLRARGMRIVLTPHAQVEFAESATPGVADGERRQAETRTLRNKWGEALGADPYYSPILSLDATPFSGLAWPPRAMTPRANSPPVATDVPAGF